MKLRTSVVAIAALALLALTACGSKGTSSQAASGSGNVVAVTLHDYKIEPAVTTVSAGEVTFTIENVGATEHEMVVIRTDVAIADMAVEGHETNEEAPGMTPIGEVEDVQPGESTDLVLTLESGRYVFLCNLPKHFERGMVTEFEVA
ncbi:MAG: cupredoxin domain-containing protein [Actinomycetota bacterium]